MSQAHPSGTLPGVPAAKASEEFAQAVQTLVPEKLLSGNLPPVKTHSVLTDRPSPAESEITMERRSEIAMENPLEFADTTRRDVLRKAVFIAPVILTLPVIPSFAKAGSDGGDDDHDDQNDGHDGNIGGGSQSQGRRRRRRRGWWFFNW
jgi:hypothetical protein